MKLTKECARNSGDVGNPSKKGDLGEGAFSNRVRTRNDIREVFVCVSDNNFEFLFIS
jgi:hypothetical protein